VEYRINIRERGAEVCRVAHIPAVELQSWSVNGAQPAQVFLCPGAAEIVVDPNLTPGPQKPVRQIGSNKASTACDQDRPQASRPHQ
jgi:hypothetical protein